MTKILIDKQELKLLKKLYKEISLPLSLDVPPTESLKRKNLIEKCSVCNKEIDGATNCYYFRLTDICRKYLDKVIRKGNIRYVKIKVDKQPNTNKPTKKNKIWKIIFIDIVLPIIVGVAVWLICQYIGWRFMP